MKDRLNIDNLKSATLLLQVGLAITFFWIGLLILQDPLAWGSYMQPWAYNLLPAPIEQVMTTTAYFDMATGFLFLIPHTAFIAGVLAALHLVGVIATSGINEGTVRDIGLLAASIAVVLLYFPKKKK